MTDYLRLAKEAIAASTRIEDSDIWQAAALTAIADALIALCERLDALTAVGHYSTHERHYKALRTVPVNEMFEDWDYSKPELVMGAAAPETPQSE